MPKLWVQHPRHHVADRQRHVWLYQVVEVRVAVVWVRREVRANAEQVLHDESPNTEDFLEAVPSGRSGTADFEEEWQASAWELRKLETRADLQCAWCGQLFELHCRLVTSG